MAHALTYPSVQRNQNKPAIEAYPIRDTCTAKAGAAPGFEADGEAAAPVPDLEAVGLPSLAPVAVGTLTLTISPAGFVPAFFASNAAGVIVLV